LSTGKRASRYPSLDAAVFAGMRFAFDQPRQIVDMRPLLGSRFLGQGFEAFEQIRTV
jgi:hypothetical protein